MHLIVAYKKRIACRVLDVLFEIFDNLEVYNFF